MNINFDNLEMHINERPERYTIDIWLIQRGIEFDQNVSIENGDLKLSKIEPAIINDEMKPFLSLPRHFADQFFKAISDYNASKGIKTKDEHTIEGKLQSTQLHLQDMQQITNKLIEFVTQQKKSR
jgi:hypothetical protein